MQPSHYDQKYPSQTHLTGASEHAPFDHAEHMAAMRLRQQVKVEREKVVIAHQTQLSQSDVQLHSSRHSKTTIVQHTSIAKIHIYPRSKANILRELIGQEQRDGTSHVQTTLTDGRPKRTDASEHYDQTPREYLPQGSSLSQMPSSTTSTIQAQQNNLAARRAKLRQSLRRLKMLLHVKGSDEKTLKAAISVLDIEGAPPVLSD